MCTCVGYEARKEDINRYDDVSVSWAESTILHLVSVIELPGHQSIFAIDEKSLTVKYIFFLLS